MASIIGIKKGNILNKSVLATVVLILVLFNGCNEETTEVIEAQPVEVEGINYGFANPQLANHTIVLESEGTSNTITLLFCTDYKVKYNNSVSGTFGLHETPSSILDMNFTKAPHTLQLHDGFNSVADSVYDKGEVLGVVVDSGTLDAYKVKSVFTAPRADCK